MSDVDLGPVLLQQFKAVAPYIGRDDMLLLSGDDHSLAFFTEDARTWVHDPTFRRCPAGHRHEVIARVFGVPFCVCPMAAEGQVWVLDARQDAHAQ